MARAGAGSWPLATSVGGVVFLLLLLLPQTPQAGASVRQTVALGPGNTVTLAQTKIHCSVSTKRELLCATQAPDRLNGGYTSSSASKEGSQSDACRSPAPRSSIRGVGPAHPARSRRPRAGAGRFTRLTSSRCAVRQLVHRRPEGDPLCLANHGGQADAGSVGFVVRSDGTGTAQRFGSPTTTLYDGKLSRPGSHNLFTLSLNDVFAVAGTNEVCAVAGDPTDLIVSCLVTNGNGGALDGTYGTLIDANNRVAVVRYKDGQATVAFARKPASATRHANDVSVEVGDRITVTGTSIGCRVDRVTDRKYVICGKLVNDTLGPAGSYATLLEQDGIAGVTQFDAKGNSHVLFLKHP